MIRKLMLLNVALLALLAALGWQLRREWVFAHQREQAFRQTLIVQKPGPAFAPLPKVDPLTAMSYSPMVQNNLFSKDRNAQVIIDPPAPPEVKPVPPFPVARGVMMWPGRPPTVLMAERPGGEQKGYRAGDHIGQWTIRSVDNRFIVLEWDGQEFKKRLDELIDRTNTMVAEAPAPAAAPAAPTNTNLGQNLSTAKTGPGPDQGGGVRGCIPGDTTPAGSVVDGWKKITSVNPFGTSCHWAQAR